MQYYDIKMLLRYFKCKLWEKKLTNFYNIKNTHTATTNTHTHTVL